MKITWLASIFFWNFGNYGLKVDVESSSRKIESNPLWQHEFLNVRPIWMWQFHFIWNSYKVFSFVEKLVQKSMFWFRRKSIWSSICRLFLHSSRPFDRCKIKLRRVVRSNMKLSEVKTSPILVLGLLRSKIWSEKIFLDYTSIDRVQFNHGSLYPRIQLFFSLYIGG